MKKGWRRETLEEVCREITDGSHFSPKVSGSGYPYVTVRDIEHDQIDFDNCKFIAEADYRQLLKNGCKPHKGDVLFSKDGTVGKVALVDYERDFVVLSSLAIVRPDNEKIDSAFLKYVMKSPAFLEEAVGMKTGAAIRRIILRNLKSIPIPLPPLAEQQRIVCLLDEAFDGLATAQANAEKNLQNARALFESYLQSVFTQRGKGWVVMTLSEATDGIFTGPFGSLLHKSDYVENGIPLVNPAHITETGIEPDLRKTVSKETARRLSSYIMREDDIVIGRRGEMGRCALVTEVEDGWMCGTGSFFIKPSSRCDTRYLVRYLRSDGCKRRLEKIAGGAVMPNLSNADLGNLSLDLPPLERQKAILQGIDDLANETQRLESLYKQKQVALAALKESLLHQAFNGEL